MPAADAGTILRRLALGGIATLSIILSLAAAIATGAIGAQASALSIRIAGNHFVDGNGRRVRLLGVNRSGTEYECMANNGFFDGPSDAASIAAMASWNVDAVRVPLNEDCWLGINGAPAAYSGPNYRNAIAAYVNRLHAAGMYAIVDLHWNAQGSLPADGKTGQGRDMADLDHAPAYWTSVATYFRNDHGVIFDLFNEPHDISWDCWLHGCSVSDGTGTWQSAGMQTLLNAVRATGATNVVTLSADGWGGDIPQWINYRPSDPAGQTAAGWHVYYPETWWSDPSRFNQAVSPVLGAGIPIVATEFGEHDCAGGWLNQFLPWADSRGLSYTAWTWDTWPDCSNPVLITNYNGTPTGYGIAYRDHLRSLGGFHPSFSSSGLIRAAPTAKKAPLAVSSTGPVVPHDAIIRRALAREPMLTPITAAARPRAGPNLYAGLVAIAVLIIPLLGSLILMRRRRRQQRHAAEIERIPEGIQS